MVKLILLVVLVLVAVMPSARAGTPPPNDDFVNAQAIGALPFTDTVDFTDATLEGGERCAWGSHQTVWYRYQPQTDGRLTVSMQYSGIDDGTIGVFGAYDAGMSCARAFTLGGTSSIQTFSVYGGHVVYVQIAIIPAQGQTPLATVTFDYPAKLDLGVSAITIDNPPVHTDYVDAPIGTRHVIHVTVTNNAGAASQENELWAEADPATTGLGSAFGPFEVGNIAAGESQTFTFTWTSAGIGQFKVSAVLVFYVQDDTNAANDSMTATSYEVSDAMGHGAWVEEPCVSQDLCPNRTP